jgi:hypothetical protein
LTGHLIRGKTHDSLAILSYGIYLDIRLLITPTNSGKRMMTKIDDYEKKLTLRTKQRATDPKLKTNNVYARSDR